MFKIKLIFLRSKSYIAIFWICMDGKYSVLDVFNKFLLIDATDRSKISSDQNRFFIALSLYPLSFFTNTPFNRMKRSVFSWEMHKVWTPILDIYTNFCRQNNINVIPYLFNFRYLLEFFLISRPYFCEFLWIFLFNWKALLPF